MSTTYAARVLSLEDSGPTVRVPMLGADQSWGPLASSVPDLEVGDQVIVTPLGQSTDRLHVLARLQARQTRQGEVVGLADRLDDIEARNTAQDARLSAIEGVDIAQGNRLTAVEGRAGALETTTGQHATRLGGIDTLNTQQNGRLSATETVANAAATQTALTALDSAALHRTGAETKAGILTLSDEPVIPPATKTTSPVRSDDKRLARPPALEARLSADYLSLAGNTWYGMRGQMETLLDNYGGWALTAGGLYQYTVPDGWIGAYSFTWQVCTDGTSYNPVIAIVCLNAPDNASNTQIAGYTLLRNPAPGQSLLSGSYRLAPGNKISLGLHVVQTGAFNLRTVLPSSNARTFFSMRWIAED